MTTQPVGRMIRRTLTAIAALSIAMFAMSTSSASAQPDPYAPGYPVGLPLVTYPNMFTVESTYVCGEGFHGVISGGLGNYVVDYDLTGATSVDLPSFEITIQGNFSSPDGYVSSANVPAGTYVVNYTVRDFIGALARGADTVEIDHSCEPPAETAAEDGVPAAIDLAGSELAFTGNEVSLPLAGSAFLIAAGAVLVRETNKRRRD